MFNLVILVLIFETISLHGLPEESYLLPSSTDDDDMYMYIDTRSGSDPKHGETRRRSTIEKNFARFGRGDLSPLLNYEYDSDGYVENFPRPTRSEVKNDQFIRFGRGNSDFVRFGRDPYKLAARTLRGNQQPHNFVRFGRSTGGKQRNKRDAEYFSGKRGGSSFVRFGRRNDNFMRFGRNHENPLALTIPTKSNEQQSDDNHEYLMKMLLEFMRKTKTREEGSNDIA